MNNTAGLGPYNEVLRLGPKKSFLTREPVLCIAAATVAAAVLQRACYCLRHVSRRQISGKSRLRPDPCMSTAAAHTAAGMLLLCVHDAFLSTGRARRIACLDVVYEML